MPPMPGAPRTSDILIPADHFMINDVTVTLTNLNHSFAGDLTAQLQHVETQTTVDLFRRIDSTMSDACGSRARMQGTYRFGDSFSGDLWSFASNAASLPAGDYVCSTSAGAKTLLVGPGGFRGQGVAGTWRLTLTDSTSSDTGSFASWTLRLAP